MLAFCTATYTYFMGAEAYSYFVPYQSDLNAALQQLREREFRAGRYYPAVDFSGEGTGAQHASIDEARMAAAEEGTHSILDLSQIADEADFCAAAPVNGATLRELYGTEQPTREQIEEDAGFLEDVDRGHGVYVVTYRDGQPDQIYFGGYSFD